MKSKYYRAVEILELHYEEHRAVSGAAYEELVTAFPEYVQAQEAYRALILRPGQEILDAQLVQPHKSWALSLTGLKQFLKNEMVDEVWQPSDRLYVYQAEVTGFYIPALVKRLLALNLMNAGQAKKFLEEEEFLGQTVIAPRLIKELAFQDYEHL